MDLQLVEPWIQELQCRFCAGYRTMNQLFIPSRIAEGAWEIVPLLYMPYVDLESTFNQGILFWGASGMWGIVLSAICSLCNCSESIYLVASGYYFCFLKIMRFLASITDALGGIKPLSIKWKE